MDIFLTLIELFSDLGEPGFGGKATWSRERSGLGNVVGWQLGDCEERVGVLWISGACPKLIILVGLLVREV